MFSKPMHTNEDTKCIAIGVASEYTKCISTSDDQTHSLPARTQKVTQHAITNTTHNYKDTEFISTRVAQTTHMPERTQTVSQNVLTKHYHASTGTK
jgi:hypothetical protein